MTSRAQFLEKLHEKTYWRGARASLLDNQYRRIIGELQTLVKAQLSDPDRGEREPVQVPEHLITELLNVLEALKV